MPSEPFDVIGECRSAQHEDEVVPIEACDNPLADGGQETGKEAMPLGKAATGRHRAHPHPRLVPFGQGDHVIPGVVAIHAGPDDDDWPYRAIETIADHVDQPRIRVKALADGASRDRVAGPFPVVHRNRHKGGTTGLLHRDVVRARDGGRHILSARGLVSPLDIGIWQPRGLGGKQERLIWQDRACLLPGGDDERRAIPVGGEDVAHGVADARRRMQVHECRVARGLRVAIGHADDNRFLQSEDVAEIVGEVAEEWQFS